MRLTERDVEQYDQGRGYRDDEPYEPAYRRKKRRRRPGAGGFLLFLFGILAGALSVLAVYYFSPYSPNNIPQTPTAPESESESNTSGETEEQREITQGDIEEIRENTVDTDKESERLLAQYVEDVEPAIRVAESRGQAGGSESGHAKQEEDSGELSEDTTDGADPGEEVSDDEASARRLLEQLRQSLVDGEGTLPSLRKAFPDQIMVTSEGKFYFFPISDELRHNSYDAAFLQEGEKGSLDYIVEGESVVKKGIDVSRYQGVIDWEKVKDDGVDFAFLRAGYRGYGSGALMADDTFNINAVSASAQGIEIGAYFFSQAVNTDEAREEAQFVLDLLGGQEIAYPIVYDLERVSGGRVSSVDRSTLTDCCLAFCETIAQAGYEPMVYGNMETFLLMLEIERLEDVRKWFAYYNPEFYYPYNYDIWQYSASGRVSGIEGKVDLNLDFKR